MGAISDFAAVLLLNAVDPSPWPSLSHPESAKLFNKLVTAAGAWVSVKSSILITTPADLKIATEGDNCPPDGFEIRIPTIASTRLKVALCAGFLV